jgi:hypothetical protein
MLLQRLPLFYHELVRDVVLVDIPDILNGDLSHSLRHQQLYVAKPFVGIQSLRLTSGANSLVGVRTLKATF